MTESVKPDALNLTWENARLLAQELVRKMLIQQTAGQIRIYGIPRGGVFAALLIHNSDFDFGPHREVALVEKPEQATVFVDDIIDSGHTRDFYQDMFNRPFFALIEKPPGNPWVIFPWERMSREDGPQENVRRILEYIGEDPKREGLLETPNRMVKSWEKLFGGYALDPKSVLKSFKDGACDEMVILRDIEFYSHCEHHMMPFFGKAHIGYIPSGRVIGISKLARLLEIYTRRMQIQERIGQQVTAAIMEHLQPQGCACVLEAVHFCMTSRGVEKQSSVMITSSMRGCFLKDHDVKAEFLGIIGK